MGIPTITSPTLTAINPTLEGENGIVGEETTQNGNGLENESNGGIKEEYNVIIGEMVGIISLILIAICVLYFGARSKRVYKSSNDQNDVSDMVSLASVETVNSTTDGMEIASPETTPGQSLLNNTTQLLNVGEDDCESDGDAMYDEDDDLQIVSPTKGQKDVVTPKDDIYVKPDSVQTTKGNTKGSVDTNNDLMDDEDEDDGDVLYMKGSKTNSPQ